MTQARITPRPNWNQSFWNPDSASIRSPVPCRWAARAIWVSSAIQLFAIFSQSCRLLYKFRLLNLYHGRMSDCIAQSTLLALDRKRRTGARPIGRAQSGTKDQPCGPYRAIGYEAG